MRSTDGTQWAPPAYERVQRRVFGLGPGALPGAAALLILAAAVVALATGDVVVGVLLLGASFLLGIVYVEQARRHGESSLERIAVAAVDQSRAFAGFAGSTAGAWTHAGREVARLRLEARRLARERSRLQYALGGAAYDDDAARVEELRTELRSCMERIDGCAEATRAALDVARRRTADERLAVASTQVREPEPSR